MHHHRVRHLMPLALLTAITGCSSQPGAPTPADPQTTSATTLDSDDRIDAPEELAIRNPILNLLHDSIVDLRLPPSQQQRVNAIRDGLTTKMQPVRQARATLASTVADGVASGTLDDVEINRQVEALAQEVERAKPAIQDSLNALHATLDSQQRRALLHGLRERGAALRDNVEDQGGPRGVVRARLGRLADDLALTDAQRATIRDRAREQFRTASPAWGPETRPARMARLREIGSAFASEQFDAKQLYVGKEGPEATRKIATGLVRLVKVLLPELTAEQRNKLAELIRARAQVR